MTKKYTLIKNDYPPTKLALIDGEWHSSLSGQFWLGMGLYTEAHFMGAGRGKRKNETPNGPAVVLYYEPANPVKI